MKRSLIVFLKRPTPGTVKTRLIPALGEQGAADLYRLLAETEVGATAPAAHEYRRQFFFTPAEARAEMEEWFPGEDWIPQVGADLGARMAAAFEEVFARGAEQAAIIGSDVPWLTSVLVVEAFEALGSHDVVLGPATDGGYYLMALRRPQPRLFEDVEWSTSTVLETTLRRASQLGLRASRLSELPDIDTLQDLARERQRLESLLRGTPLGPLLERVLSSTTLP